jgi:hypothetical protein
MSAVTLAHLDRPRRLSLWAWAITDEEDNEGTSDVRLLSADGHPGAGNERAHAQRSDAPIGTAAWLGSAVGRELTPCVVIAAGQRLRVLTPLGEQQSEPRWVWPVSAPEACPFASGAAVVTARTPLVGVAVDARRFALRWEAMWLRGIHQRDGLGGATWIDVALLPHQLAVAREVLGSPSVRHILADEVGLGKTIEALMIWSALSAHDRSLKCVVAAPRSLVSQWCLEVRRRTEHRLLARHNHDVPPVYVPGDASDAMDADNPRGLVVTEHDALGALKSRASTIDMLIVDEAHLLTSEQRDAVAAIAGACKHLLLLTATPREGKRTSGVAKEVRKVFAWAAGLVDPKWPPPDLASDDVDRALDRTVDESLRRAQQCDQTFANGPVGQAEALLDERGVGALDDVEIPSRSRDDVRSFLRASTLLERVIRTRRGAIGPGLIARRELIRVPVEYRREELAILDTVRALDPQDRHRVVRQACSSWDALAGMTGGRTTALRERLDVIRSAKVSPKPDAKLEALLDLSGRLWREDASAKIVVRCEYAETRDLVFQQLQRLLTSGGLRPSSKDERAEWEGAADDAVGPVAQLDRGQDAMLEALRNPSESGRSMLAQLWAFERGHAGGAVALVAGDVASTGLNLQFASALILYDLPWTPGLAEQWIGRLDRVGQRAGVVRVYAMSNPALPTERLLDVYESIGLFDRRGYHASPEVDRAINDLLRPSESDESTWEEAVANVRRLIDDDDDDPSRGASLDLAPVDPPPHADTKASVRGVLDAMRSSGFTVDDHAGGYSQIHWPPSEVDALEMPGASAAMGRGADRGRTPEAIAIARQEIRSVRVTEARLGHGRWVRAKDVSLFSPRHPLLAEMDDELLRDPSLALGGFRCSSAGAGVPPGTYLLVQTHTHPSLGGDAMAWGCAVPPETFADEDLARLWSATREALRRMMRIRLRADVSRTAWSLSDRGEPMQTPPQRVEALLSALGTAKPERVVAIRQNIDGVLAAMERTPSALPAGALTVAEQVAEEASRDARLNLDRLIARGQSAFERVGAGDAWRGLRESRERSIAAAQALRDALDDLPRHARAGAAEALTPRVVAAALFEVRS